MLCSWCPASRPTTIAVKIVVDLGTGTGTAPERDDDVDLIVLQPPLRPHRDHSVTIELHTTSTYVPSPDKR
jgi:hypothetical protein